MLKEVREGVILRVIVKPNARENSIEGIDEWRGRIKVNIKAQPVKGKANRELIKFLSNLFGAEVEILKGETSREKDVLVRGVNLEEVKRRLKL
ncbi:DUF167 domain-containing protein [Pyrococcus abyssi]|uniref:UPF0235 protein PYRAB05010 n=1 Tax=Pyrococcus abyssi (strain GE5 / Orsay) TaxID=272844 RepID=Y501_PYRAB|nr:DUF167 domain-containing protein [Pyrococcus abyssi]Q9V1C6.1 RecName: Full=UPF0235 protein PYRAB05010 [Pyrococcus abyssi GE5]CAB49423.1 Hypothetical protein PAB7122 [Pyrococcus abyssi GE5]CCE69890.1 TPA: hypothetical protein PAB7122 [Pyrococcus abyssi GE5]